MRGAGFLIAKRRLVAALCLSTLLVLLAACAPPPPATPNTTSPAILTLLHTNDLHAHLQPEKVWGEPEQGGMARLKTLIDRARATQAPVLLVDSGDASVGTLFEQVWQGSAPVMAFNRLGLDAATLGNHEFDHGPAYLGRLLRGGAIQHQGQTLETEPPRYPLVVTNLDVSAEPALTGLIRPSVVVEKGGLKIGILGAITPEVAVISRPGDRVRLLDAPTALNAEAQRLTALGIDHIVLLSHMGYGIDTVLAPQLHAIDVIVSGHDHAVLGDPAALTREGAVHQAKAVRGPFPTLAHNRDGDPVLIVSAGQWGRWLGRLTVAFDEAGHVIPAASNGSMRMVRGCQNHDCTLAVDEAPDMADWLTTMAAPLARYATQTVAHLDTDLPLPTRLPDGEVELGRMVAEGILAAVRDSDAAVAALINGGGIRAGLAGGAVSYAQALAVLPFDNTIATVTVDGDTLIAALDHGLSLAGGKIRGAFPQVAGMQVTYCATTPCPAALHPGGVVTRLTVAGAAVDLAQSYRIAVNDYLAGGGDGYAMLKQATGYRRDSNIPVLEAFIVRLQRPVGVAGDETGMAPER
ncbi:MAG: hypothetical protein AUJ55_00955 [Proteobacteria bacterium CG1_02_64_396]|nr:MAG: hypothetical protein AUJ55_00955 [Proteobacteria bacterium CG1_02_64_396]